MILNETKDKITAHNLTQRDITFSHKDRLVWITFFLFNKISLHSKTAFFFFKFRLSLFDVNLSDDLKYFKMKPKEICRGWNSLSQSCLSAGKAFNSSFWRSREADLKRALLELGGTVLQQVTEALSTPGGGGGGGDLPQESQNLLRGQISDLWKNNNPVRILIGQAWTQEVFSLHLQCWWILRACLQKLWIF